jgi:hypothetical protein
MTDKPVELDQHRGMAAQKATELRRLLAEVAVNERTETVGETIAFIHSDLTRGVVVRRTASCAQAT